MQNLDHQNPEAASGLELSTSGMISLRRFRAGLDVVPSTIWRWIQRGWLDQPINIGGRQYLTAAMVERFRIRAASGEFAASIKPPTRKGTRHGAD